ncbi:MAG: glycosyltransferase family 2 protein [Thermoguttaceae bacterium]|jgi:glycosyltransferase involved in cell wall biosynthesis
MTERKSVEVLTIVIPALNEEDAIGTTIARCLAAHTEICRIAGLAAVEIIVVSDGSTDRTAEIARSFAEVQLVEFEHNRGYGAAIQEGFRQGNGTLLGFLDADGTCDPCYFGEMCRLAVEERAEVVLGSRLGPGSRMPMVRRVGNRLYAVLLGMLCGRSVTDTASGMRVLRREAFELLSPLPNGLHFTPAMSTRALISGMEVREVPMAYAERIGDSKLKVLRDGMRFLQTIVEGVLCYRPDRLFFLGFVTCLLLVLLLGAYPVEFYLRNRAVEEWMIYRFLTCFLFGSCGFLLLSAVALSHQMASLGPSGRRTDSFWSAASAILFARWGLAAFVCADLLGAIGLLWPGIVEYVTSARCTLHWSRVVVGTFLLLAAFHALVTAVLIQLVRIWHYQRVCRPRVSSDS